MTGNAAGTFINASNLLDIALSEGSTIGVPVLPASTPTNPGMVCLSLVTA
jgi:hypothetical protein